MPGRRQRPAPVEHPSSHAALGDSDVEIIHKHDDGESDSSIEIVAHEPRPDVLVIDEDEDDWRVHPGHAYPQMNDEPVQVFPPVPFHTIRSLSPSSSEESLRTLIQLSVSAHKQSLRSSKRGLAGGHHSSKSTSLSQNTRTHAPLSLSAAPVHPPTPFSRRSRAQERSALTSASTPTRVYTPRKPPTTATSSRRARNAVRAATRTRSSVRLAGLHTRQDTPQQQEGEQLVEEPRSERACRICEVITAKSGASQPIQEERPPLLRLTHQRPHSRSPSLEWVPSADPDRPIRRRIEIKVHLRRDRTSKLSKVTVGVNTPSTWSSTAMIQESEQQVEPAASAENEDWDDEDLYA